MDDSDVGGGGSEVSKDGGEGSFRGPIDFHAVTRAIKEVEKVGGAPEVHVALTEILGAMNTMMGFFQKQMNASSSNDTGSNTGCAADAIQESKELTALEDKITALSDQLVALQNKERESAEQIQMLQKQSEALRQELSKAAMATRKHKAEAEVTHSRAQEANVILNPVGIQLEYAIPALEAQVGRLNAALGLEPLLDGQQGHTTSLPSGEEARAHARLIGGTGNDHGSVLNGIDDILNKFEERMRGVEGKVRAWCAGSEELAKRLQSRLGKGGGGGGGCGQRHVSFEGVALKEMNEKMEFKDRDLGAVLELVYESLEDACTLTDLTTHWDVFGETLDVRLEGCLRGYVDAKLQRAMLGQDGFTRDDGIRVIKALSSNADYQHCLTR